MSLAHRLTLLAYVVRLRALADRVVGVRSRAQRRDAIALAAARRGFRAVAQAAAAWVLLCARVSPRAWLTLRGCRARVHLAGAGEDDGHEPVGMSESRAGAILTRMPAAPALCSVSARRNRRQTGTRGVPACGGADECAAAGTGFVVEAAIPPPGGDMWGWGSTLSASLVAGAFCSPAPVSGLHALEWRTGGTPTLTRPSSDLAFADGGCKAHNQLAPTVTVRRRARVAAAPANGRELA